MIKFPPDPQSWSLKNPAFSILMAYLSTTEKFLASRAEEMRTIEKEYFLQRGWSPAEIESGVDDLEFQIDLQLARYDSIYGPGIHADIERYFSSLLRRSLFVTAYSIFEDSLYRKCKSIQKNLYSTKYSVDLRYKGIKEMVKDYLMGELGLKLDLSSSPEWNDITTYIKLRNCIVHNSGRLIHCDHSNYLQHYVSRHQHLYVDAFSGEVEMKQGFCEKVVQVFDKFGNSISQSFDGLFLHLGKFHHLLVKDQDYADGLDKMDIDTVTQQIHKLRKSEPDDINFTDRGIAKRILSYAKR